MMIAGSGALAPMAVSFLAVDAKHVFSDLTTAVLAGYMFRCLVLFAMGAMVGWLNTSVRDRKTLFQLGITAPALVSGFITAAPTPSAESAAADKQMMAMMAPPPIPAPPSGPMAPSKTPGDVAFAPLPIMPATSFMTRSILSAKPGADKPMDRPSLSVDDSSIVISGNQIKVTTETQAMFEPCTFPEFEPLAENISPAGQFMKGFFGR